MIIQLTQTELSKIKTFCNDVHTARSNRDRRNKDEGEHRIVREMVGKIGEYAAWKATGIGQVDFKIYKDREVSKNCDGDLTPYTHVKTCAEEYRGTKYDGWLISLYDRWFDKPQIDDRIILCYAKVDGWVDVAGWVKATEMKPFYRLPQSRKLTHKLAWYAEDINHLIYDLGELS